MKSIIIFVIISMLSIPVQTNEYIEIEHIGISDKPILIIVISKKIINRANSLNFIVDSLLYNETIKILKENLDSTKAYDGIEYGSFKFSIYKNGSEIYEYNVNRLNSNQIIDQILDTVNHFENNSKLELQLKALKRRIKYR